MDELYTEAMERFADLYREARNFGVANYSTMALATSDLEGRPSVRTVNLKHYDERGFVFFTNANSGKGVQLAANPRAALCFYWDKLSEQIVIEGEVEIVETSLSDKLWASRSHEHKISAWASQQSDPVLDAEDLKRRLKQARAEHPDANVPRPPYWSGYRVLPDRIEFWRAGWRAMKGRLEYRVGDAGWESRVLNP